MFSMPLPPLPYAQATPLQRAHARLALQERLRAHFPALPARVFARALDEFRPVLLFDNTHLRFAPQALIQLVQHLAASPELPLLDPPVYGPAALDLAQYVLCTGELAAGTALALAARRAPCPPPCGPCCAA